jgi:hypothetical protein
MVKIKSSRGWANIYKGQKVTTTFDEEEKRVIRTVTRLEKNDQYGSGYLIVMSGGPNCPTCHRSSGEQIGPVDAAWAIPYYKPKKKV